MTLNGPDGEPNLAVGEVDLDVPEVTAETSTAISIVDDLARKRLFNLDFIDSADLRQVADVILARAEPQHGGQLPVVVTPNVDIVVQMNERPTSVETGVLLGAQFCLPDGQPIVTASRLLGRPLATRLAGRLLFAEMWPRLIERSTPVTVVASSDEISEGLAAENPNANIIVAPFFDQDETNTIDDLASSIVDDAKRLGTQFVMSGIGFPKDLLIAESVIRHWSDTDGRCPTSMGLGASFAFHLGLTEKAPEWMQRVGLEWFHRFCQEPQRLFHRYFVRDAQFLPLVVTEWQAARRSEGGLSNG